MPDTLSIRDQLFPAGVAADDGYPAGAAALDAVHRVLTRFLWFTRPEDGWAVTLWTAYAWGFRAFAAGPRLALTSKLPGCAKTLCMELVMAMSPNPLMCAGLTGPALMHAIAEDPVLGIDEYDVVFGASGKRHEDVRGILNAGYKASGVYIRASGNSYKKYFVYAPCVFAGIGALPPTLEDRSAVIVMSRPSPGSRKPERYRARMHEGMVTETGRACGEWVRSVLPELAAEIPEEIDDVQLRAEEIWDSLRVIGILAGGPWKERADAACRALVLGSGDSVTLPPDLRLLADIRAVLGDRDRMPSSALVRALMAVEGSPWQAWPVTTATAQLSGMLSGHGIAPRPMRTGNGRAARCYVAADFRQAWAKLPERMSHAR